MTSTHRPLSLAIGGLVALAVAMGIGRFVYTPILPFMVESIPLTAAQAGLIASANFVGYLAGALLAATPWIAGSRRTWLLRGLAGSAITTILTAALTSVPFLAAVRFVGGAASAFVLVFASTVILERLAAAGEGRLSSVHFAGVGSGIAFSALVVALLAALGFGWQMQWATTGLVSLLSVPIVARLVPPDPISGAAPPRPAPMSLNRPLAAIIIAYGLFGFGYVITATFLVAIVRGSADIRYLEPVVWVIVGLASVPSVALWNVIGRRIGVFAAFAAACLVEAVGVAASVLAVNTIGVVLAALCLGGTFMAITALGLVGARSLTDSDPRRVLALMTVAFGIGQIAGPLVGGVIIERSGSYTLASIIAAGTLVVAALLAARLGRASARA